MQFKFCPECGEKLITKTIGDEGETSFCENCGRPWFSFSYPCVICLLTDGAGKYALIRQTYATRNYVCVAGFIKEHETAEQTALRNCFGDAFRQRVSEAEQRHSRACTCVVHDCLIPAEPLQDNAEHHQRNENTRRC